MLQKKSRILKLALFATGLSGIVAEYILSTLATYFLGDSVFQWTMILSIMLFSMGVGSRLSTFFTTKILEKFLIAEFLLSILTSTAALATYFLMGMTENIGVVIYSFSISIGLLIGMEIPLVTRINEENEELRTNIAGVMENDYYGSLIGGLFFVFIGLPFLGLTHTPFILGGVNFLVAIALFIRLKNYIDISYRLPFTITIPVILCIILFLSYNADEIVLYGEQKRYNDKVVFSKQTRYQKITITQWKEHYWLYLNSSKQLCTFDEFLYHEPLVHPVMKLTKDPRNVLILGAGDGCAIREVLKYKNVEQITLVDIDPEMTKIGKTNEIFTTMNDSAYYDPKVRVVNQDAFQFLENTTAFYDVMILDFPDPKSIDLNRVYTKEFYRLCHRRLRPFGHIITQAVSPYYTTKAFRSIEKTIGDSGFNVLPIRNHVYSFGEWGWVIGSKQETKNKLKERLLNMNFDDLDVEWITNESMNLMTSFGRDLIKIDSVEVNTVRNPVLYKYYLDGTWAKFL
ncbi:polyamine aminopropyltransferase [Aquimarina sp. RZ0]|uniref:polyamine aminopropyltransferase n=1 Tax=Aquimarina sp. RZ0 TaxID=2607730 RepID=UPI0011F1CBFE|nr:polyamine aminopropyltransferase [Aquimarina sp. RZ0]KAA1248028.1 polyamine aminopropyltransferase [Aquimarina sp. RZ0]